MAITLTLILTLTLTLIMNSNLTRIVHVGSVAIAACHCCISINIYMAHNMAMVVVDNSSLKQADSQPKSGSLV